MRNLFSFILRNHAFILFILLEAFSFVLIFNFNNYQKSKFLNSSSRITARVYESYSHLTDYLSLPSINRQLSQENARLRTLMGISAGICPIPSSELQQFADQEHLYRFIPARIISNSVDRQHKYITLDKGSVNGIKPDMGIITMNGVAGIITNVSPYYSTGMSLLNTRWNISAKLRKNNYFGSLVWDGKNYQKALLKEIPFHVSISTGDTIVTSGYSTIFPEGILLGTIDGFEKEGGENFFTIHVRLSVDFKSISFVEVIENTRKEEIEMIQKFNENVD